ncbi:hypothetical protein AURDEDRAFT_110725 [Auricularia subglabra TFB-10046 SS5]|nr:hypothetical protein AURDEDRAFT_110725 [Auricularia subglabra TFB-10046 SS5]
MVFANLGEHEKQAFFSLLDEYFESRPHLRADGTAAGITPAQASAVASAGASMLGRAAAANPRAANAALNAGLQRAGVANANVQITRNGAPVDDEDEDSKPQRASVASRIAAFGAAGLKPPVPGGGAPKPPPPAPPRRGGHTPEPSADEDAYEAPHPPVRPPIAPRVPTTPSGLVTEKKFQVFGSKPPKESVTPPPPAGLPNPKSDYGPPPVRRVPSSTSMSSKNPSPPASMRSVSSGGGRKIPPIPKAVHAEPEPMEEWAEVLYDYDSGEATDLAIEAGQRILIIEHSSEEWWKGELKGKQGLFPSSYVRML